MDDKLKVFWNLDVLVKMCRSKSDGPSLRIEEEEIETKIKNYSQEIEEINSISEEDIYDTSAEMADRNIEIISKKQIQALKNELKEKTKELTNLKEEEETLYNQTALLRDNKNSQEKYMMSMQARICEATESEIIDRYNALIAETSEYIAKLETELEERSGSYEEVQNKIIELTDLIQVLEEKIDKKKKLLAETQASLENKENYIDKSKRDKNNKRIVDLEAKKQVLNKRLEEIRNEPKYLESRIKDIINNKQDITTSRPFLINLLNQAIKIPYINVPADKNLEEELLRATQARDSFANEIDQKSYNILEANTPEKIRIEFLTNRIEKWKEELETLKRKISLVDKDAQFDYEAKDKTLSDMIKAMKKDLMEFQRAYEETPDSSISAKASIKASLDERKEDIIEAEKIATAFKKDEAEDIANATRTVKYECENLNKKIQEAEEEINAIRNRLTSKKSGLIDITSKNKDKDILKELAQIVIDIKHRRQFPETPIEVIHRLEESLELDLTSEIDTDYIEATSTLSPKDYDKYIAEKDYELVDTLDETFIEEANPEKRRGVKVINEAEISIPSVLLEEQEERIEPSTPAMDEKDEETEDTSSTDESKESAEGKEDPIEELSENQEQQATEEETEEETTPVEESAGTEEAESNSSEENTLEPEDNTSKTEPEETSSEEKTEEIQEEINETEINVEEETEKSKKEEEEAIKEIPEIEKATSEEPESLSKEEEPLTIDSIFNPQKKYTEMNEKNTVTREYLSNELDQYINNLEIKEN